MLHHIERALLAILSAATLSAAPPVYRAVYYVPDQAAQPSGITEGSPGLFYIQANGTFILSVTVSGTGTTVATFQDPPYLIESRVISGPNHLIYSSVTSAGPNGKGQANVFSVGPTPGGQESYPPQALLPYLTQNLPNGTFLASLGVYSDDSSALGIVDTSGKVTSLYQFPQGDLPNSVLYGGDGNYYGAANTRGAPGYVYQLTQAGSFTKLGTVPFPGIGLVLQASDGNFYGTTPVIGGAYAGSVFKLTPAGQYMVLHTFGNRQSGVIDALLEGSDGKLYGVTEGQTFFSLTTSGQYKLAYQEKNGHEGVCPCSMIQGSDGIFYGTAAGGGLTGAGEVFALDLGLPRPAPKAQHFVPESGVVGTKIRIWGYNLLSASVQFNGVASTAVTNSGPNYVYATVPEGATTGPITITTPGGTVATKANFTVP
jgi:uncharacterized repeat protein (TIGR03803 family)